MTANLAAVLKLIHRLIEEAEDELPPDERVGLGALLTGQNGVRLADKGWFSMREAMAWTGFGRKQLNDMIKQRRLWYQKFPGRGGKGEIRIPRAHLDDQMAKRFPVLDLPRSMTEAAIADFLVHNRPVTRLIPGPKQEDDDSLPPPRVY